MPNTLVRLTGEVTPPHALVLDDDALRRRRQHELAKVRQMVGYANARDCRRHKILGYFGETWDKPNCGACDHCLSATSPESTATHAIRAPSEGEWLVIQKILSCVARMRGRYGRTRVVQVLQGSRAREILGTHLAQLSTYGILKGSPREMIDAYLEALIGAGCVDIVGDEYPKLEVTEHGQAVMRRLQNVELPLPAEVAAPASAAEAAGDPLLLQRLQARRRALADAASLPAYCIVNNRTLQELAQRRPTERHALLQIHGIGEEKARKYGEAFLHEIRDHLGAKATREV